MSDSPERLMDDLQNPEDSAVAVAVARTERLVMEIARRLLTK